MQFKTWLGAMADSWRTYAGGRSPGRRGKYVYSRTKEISGRARSSVNLDIYIRTAFTNSNGDVVLESQKARVHADVDELHLALDDARGSEAGDGEEEGKRGDGELHVCSGELVGCSGL